MTQPSIDRVLARFRDPTGTSPSRVASRHMEKLSGGWIPQREPTPDEITYLKTHSDWVKKTETAIKEISRILAAQPRGGTQKLVSAMNLISYVENTLGTVHMDIAQSLGLGR